MSATNPILNRYYDARLHTLPGAPSLRTATLKQVVEHRNQLKLVNADKIVPRFGIDPEDEHGFFASACHCMLEEEDFWQQRDLVFAWVDQRPGWCSPVHWDQILPDPPGPTTRVFRLTLLGGGQITVTEHFERAPDRDWCSCYHPALRVTADAGDGLKRYAGTVDGPVYEMGAQAVLFHPGTPQSIADRTAATFRLLDPGSHPTVRGPDPENFAALLDRGLRCCMCNRPLRDHVSTLLGIGPDCARQFLLPHSLESANRILARRRELLGDEYLGVQP